MLTDPDIEEPAQIAFDGNGRMFVLELRGYMQDADGDGELLPVGRISMHEDRDHDGIYETHHVFVDKLIFPRFVMPLGKDAVLTKESNADEVWKFTDTNGDGVADKKELFGDRLRPAGQRRAPGERPGVGHGQLDVQHGQRRSASGGRRTASSGSRPDRTAPSGA